MNPITAIQAFCLTVVRRVTAGDERGNSAVEYALILALVVVVCILAVSFIGESTGESLSSTGSMLVGG